MLKIIRAGMYTTVQDGGRHGFRQSGISHCGALDMPALRIANLLVGNDANAPALEITLGQLTVEFETDGWFALTGAGCDARNRVDHQAASGIIDGVSLSFVLSAHACLSSLPG